MDAASRVQSFLAKLQVTGQGALDIRHYPQRSEEWFAARKHRLTMSNAAAAAGVNKWCSPEMLVVNLLWGQPTTEAMAYGTEHEEEACEEFTRYIRAIKPDLARLEVEHQGLTVPVSSPWLGCSPDGIVSETKADGSVTKTLLEIKCPWSRRRYYPSEVPAYYVPQIQGLMHLLGLSCCYFYVFLPESAGGSRCTPVLYDSQYCEEFLMPRLREFYFGLYVPCAILYEEGMFTRKPIIAGASACIDTTPAEDPEALLLACLSEEGAPLFSALREESLRYMGTKSLCTASSFS